MWILKRSGLAVVLLLVALTAAPRVGFALAPPTQPLPGPADSGRIDQRQQSLPPELPLAAPLPAITVLPSESAPANSKHVRFTLRSVQITGMTVYKETDVQDLYAASIGYEISLDQVWDLAARLTARYRDAGYFLTRVVVPEQEIVDGTIHLHAIEGYIGEVNLDAALAEHRVANQWLDRLQSYRPLKASQIESILLHLNDLPGVDLHAVLEPMQSADSPEGAVRLVLQQRDEKRIYGSVSIDNYSSRYLGPYEAQAQVATVLVPMQRTSLSLLGASPLSELKYASLRHDLPVYPAVTLSFYGSDTSAAPGYTLKPEDIRSHSSTWGVSVDDNFYRRRQTSFTGTLALEGQETKADILGTPLTRDQIRALRLSANYQHADDWHGFSSVNATLSRGLSGLGASRAGELNLSRAAAVPDFTKLRLDAARSQVIGDVLSLITSVGAQVSSKPLYSSEQFGYGGQAYGRAYDNSELIGDRGVEGSAELRYEGLHFSRAYKPQPYVFYDIGKVWSKEIALPTEHESAASAGSGIHMFAPHGLSANLGFALPLTRRAANPLHGDGNSARVLLQLAYSF